MSSEWPPSMSAQSSRIADRTLSSEALVHAYLDRIRALDCRLHSFVDVFDTSALANARTADADIAAGRWRGPLHGVAYGLKDVFDVQGHATTGGSAAFRGGRAVRDAEVVRRLEEQGAILLGKLATHELTHGGVGADLPWPPPRNPWNTEYDTGGSSSGAGAAVAAALCAFAIGTDTGGSVRTPAALCGVAGLKPTYGLVSLRGSLPNAPTLDHCGVLAQTAADCGVVLDAIAGYDPLYEASCERPVETCLIDAGEGLRGLRVGIVGARWLGNRAVEPIVASALAAAADRFAACGAQLETIEMRAMAEYNGCKLTLQRPEFLSAYGGALRDRPNEFSDKLRRRTEGYQNVTAVDYLHARAQRHAYRLEMIDAMRELDVLLAPAALAPAPLAAEALSNQALNEPDVTIPFSVTGFPAIAVCIGYSPDGLPLAMQLVAKPFDERTLMRAAVGYERGTGSLARRPFI